MRGVYFSWICILCGFVVSVQANPLGVIDERLENSLMQHLQEAKQGQKIMAFTTDGCSGGLSEGWQYIAVTFPAFQRKFGDRPVWEHCCVEHDKAYWQGETLHGYEKRREADLVMKKCVIASATQHKQRLAQEFNISETQVDKAFVIAADLMYRAIRIGGKPCSIFSWRWGYGWPACHILK